MGEFFGRTCALSEFRPLLHLRTIGKNNGLKGAYYRNFVYLCGVKVCETVISEMAVSEIKCEKKCDSTTGNRK